MHGEPTDNELPVYGNKVIANRGGEISLHGVVRTRTWTTLDSTVNPGDTVLTL